jgi:secondary thiamine-phosphate synthase enzyme
MWRETSPPPTRPWCRRFSFAHAEGNSDSHLLATLLGSSISIPVEVGRLQLGTWQGIFFVDLDGPRTRRVWVSVV